MTRVGLRETGAQEQVAPMRCGCFVGVVIQVLYTSLGCEGENELEVGRLKKLLLKKDNGTITFEIYLNVTAKAQVSIHQINQPVCWTDVVTRLSRIL